MNPTIVIRSAACITAVLALGALTACGDKQPPAQPAAPQPAPTTQMTPEQLEAESSLSVKRGVIILTDASRRFRACGGNAETKLTDQTDGLLDRVYGELGGKAIYVEAYGERADNSDFVLEEILYATANGIEAACATPATRYELYARGSEPTWSARKGPDLPAMAGVGDVMVPIGRCSLGRRLAETVSPSPAAVFWDGG